MTLESIHVRKTILGLLLATAAIGTMCIVSADNLPAGDSPAVPMAHAATNEVNIANFSFHPAVLIVKAGTRVTWTNHDSTPHTVTSSDKHFASSGGLDTGDQYSVTFDKPGTYAYFCSLHPMMVAKVIVQPAD